MRDKDSGSSYAAAGRGASRTSLMPALSKTKSAAVCALAAAVKIALLSPFRIVSQELMYSGCRISSNGMPVLAPKKAAPISATNSSKA